MKLPFQLAYTIEMYQETIGEVIIWKTFYSSAYISDIRRLAQLSTEKRDHTESFYLCLTSWSVSL